MLFCASSDFVEFLCSIPNSPLFLNEDRFVTISLDAFSALREFVSKAITSFVPRPCLSNPVQKRLCGDHMRTCIRKRKVLTSDSNMVPNVRRRLLLCPKNGKVGITLPEVEIRFEHLCVDAEVYLGGRAMPTLLNSVLNMLETISSKVMLYKSNKKPLSILKDVSGIIKPGRLTLLLGPPGPGKTTLLKALAGKLYKDLKVVGEVAYNGCTMKEFVPERTSVYISQLDVHNGDMTVRETLDFSARCLGVGHRFDVISELSRRGKHQQIKPEPDIDFFMKAVATEGQKANIVTDYTLKLLLMKRGQVIYAGPLGKQFQQLIDYFSSFSYARWLEF